MLRLSPTFSPSPNYILRASHTHTRTHTTLRLRPRLRVRHTLPNLSNAVVQRRNNGLSCNNFDSGELETAFEHVNVPAADRSIHFTCSTAHISGETV